MKFDHFVKMVSIKDSNLIKNKSGKRLCMPKSISCQLCAHLGPWHMAPAVHALYNGEQHILEYFWAQGAHYFPGEVGVAGSGSAIPTAPG